MMNIEKVFETLVKWENEGCFKNFNKPHHITEIFSVLARRCWGCENCGATNCQSLADFEITEENAIIAVACPNYWQDRDEE